MSELQSARKIVKGSGFVLLANLINALLGFATSAVIARYLLVEQFGEFSIVIAIFSTLLLFCGLGVTPAATRYLSECGGSRDAVKGIIRDTLVLTALSGILLTGLMYFFAQDISSLFGKSILGYVRIMAFGITFAGVMAALLSLFQGFQRLDLSAVLTVFHNFAKLVTILAVLSVGLGLSAVLFGLVVTYTLTAGLGLYLLHRIVPKYNSHSFGWRRLLGFGLPASAAFWLHFLSTRTSLYFLGFYSTSTNVGIYSGALIFLQAFFMVPDAINAALFPALSELKGRSQRSSVKKVVMYASKFSAILSFPTIVYLGVFAPFFLSFILGSSYLQSASILRIMMLAGVAYFFYTLGTSILLAVGNPKVLTKAALILLVSVILVDIILIPIYGASGAALADGLAYLVAAFLLMRTLKKFAGISLSLGLFSKTAASALAMGLFLYSGIGGLHSVASGIALTIIGGSIYLASLFMAGVLTKADFSVAATIFEGRLPARLIHALSRLK